MKYFPIPESERWRIGPLTELMSSKFEIPGFTENEIKKYYKGTKTNKKIAVI